MHRYLSLDMICSKKQTVLWVHSSRKTESFEKQMLSKNKYLAYFLRFFLVFYYPSNIFGKLHSFENWGIITLIFLSFIYHVTCLDQLHVNKNLRWIMMFDIYLTTTKPVGKKKREKIHSEDGRKSFWSKLGCKISS